MIRRCALISLLIICLFLIGCAGVSDFTIPAIHVTARLQSSDKITFIRPYNKSHLKKMIKTQKFDVMEHNKKEVCADESGDFTVYFTSNLRAGIFWIIPPFLTLFDDHSSDIIVCLNQFPACGIVIDTKNRIKVYYFDTNRGKMCVDQNNLIQIENLVREQEDDPYNAGRKQNVDKLKILIKNEK